MSFGKVSSGKQKQNTAVRRGIRRCDVMCNLKTGHGGSQCVLLCVGICEVLVRTEKQTDRQTGRQTHETVTGSLFVRETERTDMKTQTQTHICWEDNRRNNILEFEVFTEKETHRGTDGCERCF